MKNAAYKKIFISYRVQDTAGETGRLVDALKQYFTDDQLFMDIENLEPGTDFTVAIEKSLDTCDVFLAVIGPYWLGNRNGGEVRINDPADWVRLEVSTALQRNIRVVPVLVDDAGLPKAEQLPPDLQPLLRRQSIEISNKRWRYDTDQLIQFLINTAGIQPLKAATQTTPVPPLNKKKKTWLYVAGGFGLAVIVFIILALLLPEEKKLAGSTYETEQPQSRQNISPTNHSDIDEASVQTGAAANKTHTDVAGIWEEVDEDAPSTFVLQQNGGQLGVQVEALGQVISTGTGEINGRNVELHFLLLGIPTTLKAALSTDGNSMKGTYVMQASGETQPIRLVRK